jgi:N-acetylneuraminate epimerase
VQEGLAGAYSAKVGDTILIAGGANFHGARAAAEAGNWYAHDGLSKHWASEVFALQNGAWSQVGQLPEGMAYGGAFSVEDGLLVVGGEDGARAARNDVYLVKLDGDDLVIAD